MKVPPRTVQWADKQYLTEGWLASRTPTQYLTVATRPSLRRLDIQTGPDGLEVTNKLDAVVDLLVVRGPDGRLYRGQAVPPDQKAKLYPLDEPSATAEVRRILADNQPEFPVGYYGGRNPGLGRRGYGRSAYSSQSFEESGSLLDRALDALVAPGGSSGRSLHIDHQSYLAITRTGPEVEMGVSRYREEASFHVILGRW
jgi:hypothetical protein